MKIEKIGKTLRTIEYYPLIVWVSIGFMISYLLLFFYRTFFSSGVMLFPVYIPYFDPIGADLYAVVGYASDFLIANQSPYVDIHPYPPLTNVLVFPFINVDYFLLYRVLSLLTLACFCLSFFVFWGKLKESKSTTILLLLLTTGLFSYGFQFEIERGQFNVISIFLSFLALWIFHYKPKYRFLAYLFFTIAIQLKVWPLFFLVMFIKDWRDWKNNLKRFVLLGIVNFSLLFVLGIDIFSDYIGALTRHAIGPGYVGKYNHSIKSFLLDSLRTPGRIASFVDRNYDLLFWTLLILTVGCLIYLVFNSYKKNEILSPLLLLACTLGALMITPTSHDYTMATLAGPVAWLYQKEEFWLGFTQRWKKVSAVFMLVGYSVAYSFTLFSSEYKPAIIGNLLKNNFIPLFTMLIIITVIQLLHKKEENKNASEFQEKLPNIN